MNLDRPLIAAPSRTEGRAIVIATVVARILMGLLFVMAGGFGFVFLLGLMSPPPQPGLAGQFQDAYFRSHWVLLSATVQLIGGILLLINRYVTLALTLLGAVIANILAFHLSMQPQTIGGGILALLLWLFLARRYRAGFAPLWMARSTPG